MPAIGEGHCLLKKGGLQCPQPCSCSRTYSKDKPNPTGLAFILDTGAFALLLDESLPNLTRLYSCSVE